jgi:hypothetical protein
MLEADSKHSIEPDKAIRISETSKCGILTSPNRVQSQREWPNVGMQALYVAAPTGTFTA